MLPGTSWSTLTQGVPLYLSSHLALRFPLQTLVSFGSVRIRKPHTASRECIWVHLSADPDSRHGKDTHSMLQVTSKDVFRITVLDTPRHSI